MLVKEKQTCWSGVRNYAARINLRAKKKEMKFYTIRAMKGHQDLAEANLF